VATRPALELALVEAARLGLRRGRSVHHARHGADAHSPEARPSSPRRGDDRNWCASAPHRAGNTTEASVNPQTVLLDRWKDVLKAATKRSRARRCSIVQAIGHREGQRGAGLLKRSAAREDGEGSQPSLRAGALQEVIGEPLGVRCILSREPGLKQAAREPETSGRRSRSRRRHGGNCHSGSRRAGDGRQAAPAGRERLSRRPG